MKNLTVLSVNWNAKEPMELMLKSYVAHHHYGERLNLILVDNGSQDGSVEWLKENDIPFISLPENVGHEEAINRVYQHIKTQYVLLVDTDIEFYDNVWFYVSHMDDMDVISAGELIDKNYMGQTKIKDRISPWFWLFDIRRMKTCRVGAFRTKEDWTYDVGSEYWEWMVRLGFKNHHIPRRNKHEDQDSDLISMVYDKFCHWGKVSWDVQEKHTDRYSEVMRRRYAINSNLKKYEHIDLKNKFVCPLLVQSHG